MKIWLEADAADVAYRISSGSQLSQPAGTSQLSAFADDASPFAAPRDAFDFGAPLIATSSADDAPILTVPLPDRDGVRDEPFFFQIPAGAFTDGDATLTYKARLANGQKLPHWLTFDPDLQTFHGTPPNGFTGGLDITVIASDGIHKAQDTFHLAIEKHNAAPVAASIADQVVKEGHHWSFQLPNGTFTDADSHDLTYTALLADGNAIPYWLHFDPLTQTFTGAPPQDFNGVLDLVVTADDGSRTGAAAFQLTVAPAPDGPVNTQPIADVWASEDAPFGFTIPAGSFVDPDGDALTYSAKMADGSALPHWLHFDPATQTFSGTPPTDFNGDLRVKVIASDGALKGSDPFTLHVVAINDGPVVAHPIADAAITAGDSFTYHIAANAFHDVDDSSLSYSATLADGNALPGWLHFDAATRTFSGTPPASFTGPVAVSVLATDGVNTASDTFSFGGTAPFVANAITDQTVGETPIWTFTVPDGTFGDFDSAHLTYTASLANGDPLPDWLTFDSATQTFSGAPPEDWNGHERLTVTASDGTHQAHDTFNLDQTGDFRYQISGTTWGRNAPSEIHYLWNSAYFDTSFAFGAGFDVGFSGFGVHGGFSGSTHFNAAIQAGLLLEFTLKPDTFNMTESFDVNHGVSAFQVNADPTVQVTGEVEDTTSFHSDTPDDAFFLHAFAGIAGTASLEVAGGVSAGIDGIGDVGVGFDHTFDLPSIPKITIADGKFTKPDGDVGAVEVTVKTGDPVFTLDLDSSGIGHIVIGPPSKATIDTFDFVDPATPNGGLQTLHAQAVSDPFIGANIDLDALAIKIVPEIAPLFHASLGVDIGVGSLGASLDSNFALVGDLSFGKAFFFTPEVDYSMTTSYGETLTGVAGDQQEFHTPEGEGSFTVDATYTTKAIMQSVIFLQGNIHVDYSVLKAAVSASVGVGDFSLGGSYDFPAALAGSLGLFTFAIPIFSASDEYTLDQSKHETFTVQYEKFRTVDGSGHTFAFTTHQLTASGSNDLSGDNLTGNALDNTIFGKGGDDTLFGLAGMDTLSGSLGNDTLYGGSGFNTITGGDGNDFIQSGNNGSNIDAGDGNDIIKTGSGDDVIVDTLGAVNITDSGGTNTITLGNLSYNLTFNEGNNTLHTGLGDDMFQMGLGNDHVFAGDGTNVINLGAGNNSTDGGAGTDTVTAGSGDDFIDVMAGNNTVNAGDGNNTIVVAGSGTNDLTGGAGDDHFQLYGDVGQKSTVHAGEGDNQVFGISAGNDTVFCGSGNDSISVGDGGSHVDAGAGNDFVSGGAGKDAITGGLGADNMGGGGGRDILIYVGAVDSTSITHDRIFSFDVHQDVFDLPTAVTGIDSNRSGSLNAATFDHDLRKIFSATHLAAGHAAVATPSSGDLSGHFYLVIDGNGVAGYQQGQDYVMELAAGLPTHFNLGDFV